MIGSPGQLVDGFVLGGGNHAFVDHILIRIKHRLLTACLWNLCPQAPGTLTTTIADVKSNDLARLRAHAEPNPLFVRLLLHEAAHFIGFHLQALDHDVHVARDRLDMQMIRQGLKTVDDETPGAT